MFGDLAYKHKRGSKVMTQGKTGTEVYRADGTLQHRERHIVNSDPYAPNSYYEKIVNPAQGVHIEKHERLIDHR